MNEVLKTTLSLSCSGALLIVILLLLRPLYRTRLSRQWQYYIWLVVAARLLLPFAPEINLMGTLFQEIGNRAVQTEYAFSQTPPFTHISQNDYTGTVQNSFIKEKTNPAARNGTFPNERPVVRIWNQLWLFWLVTALLLIIRKITIFQSFVKYIRAGCVEVTDIHLLERFGELVEQCDIKTSVELYTNSLISSPLLIGFFRPCIILPTAQLSESSFQYTILHELTHYKRRDMFYKWLVQLTICIHWFNPLVWLMSHKIEQACELSCDEAIIKGLHPQERLAYGDTLMNAMANGGAYKNKISSVTLTESREQLQERLDAIANFHAPSTCLRFLTISLTIAICTGASAAGAYAAGSVPARPAKIGDLTLFEKEYTLDELKTLHVSALSIAAYSDDIFISRGGDTLKFEYYAQSPNQYVFRDTEVPFHHSRGLYLSRSSSTGRDGQPMMITIPEPFSFDSFSLTTTSGNISLSDCTAKSIMVQTQNGEISMQSGSVSEFLHITTQTGDVSVNETVLPDSEKDSSFYSIFETTSGIIFFQPPDRKEHYSLTVDYGEDAELFINGEGVEPIDLPGREGETIADHSDGNVSGVITEFDKKLSFILNEKASKKIRFISPRGTLSVQEK